MVGRVSPQVSARLVMFTYYNPIMRRGAERFCQQAKAAGASGAQLPCAVLNPVLTYSWRPGVQAAGRGCRRIKNGQPRVGFPNRNTSPNHSKMCMLCPSPMSARMERAWLLAWSRDFWPVLKACSGRE